MEYKAVCETCGEERDGITTMAQWAEFQRHGKGHHPRLINPETGEVVATGVTDAAKILRTKAKEGAKEEGKVEDTTEIEFTEKGETLFPIKAWLPSTIFTLYSYAKANELIDHDNVIKVSHF